MTFYLGALVLGLIACLFVLLPLMVRREGSDDIERRALNVALYREHVSELASEEDSEELTLEAQKVLLSETGGDDPDVSTTQGTRNVFLVSAILLPLFAALIYLDFGFGQGAISDVELKDQLENIDPTDRTAYRRFVGQVEARVAQKPDDDDLQFLLARAYLNIDEYAASAEVMKKLVERFPMDANLLSHYAEILYIGTGRQVTPEVDAAIDRALRANPHDVTMMEIRAITAMEANDGQTALLWLQRALATGISGQRADMIRMAMARIGGTSASTEGGEKSTGRKLEVSVSGGPDLELKDSAVVFVYARAASGPPAPLAVQRFPVSQLPATLVLDESMAMVPGMGLGNFDEVVVIARISQSGEVAPAAGDYEARSGVLNLKEGARQVTLEIVNEISE